VSMNQI
jgi:Leucine-rich repeat (LRR) protein